VSTDDSGEFIIKFEVTATDSDVYVPRTAGRDFTNSKSNGVNFGVYNATYIDVTTGSTTQTLTSTADIEGAYFVVQEGETETFTVIVNFDPATPGFYRVGLKSLNWKSKVTVPDISINTRTVFDPVAFRTKVLAI
jgi:hypothetical protein